MEVKCPTLISILHSLYAGFNGKVGLIALGTDKITDCDQKRGKKETKRLRLNKKSGTLGFVFEWFVLV